MPISKKQLIANRQNAQKSTGPKTAHGKAVISRNAFKHGLYADDIIIDSPYLKENKVEYDLLLSSLIDELKPIGRFQEYLVCKIANCLWRSRRAIIAETAQINRQLKNVNADLRLDSILNRLRNLKTNLRLCQIWSVSDQYPTNHSVLISFATKCALIAR
jgi:hypothetical protein